MNLDDLTPKKLDLAGVQTLIEWAQEEGWNPGPHDAEVFYLTDPDGFYGYFLEDQMIAGGAVISYNGVYGFMGLFIVKSAYRGLGIGRHLWYFRRDLLINRLAPHAPIGMDGVLAMQPFYQAGGFQIAFKDERYECTGTAFEIHPNVRPINKEDVDQISSFDSACFGTPRPQFLQPWLQLPGSFTFQYGEQGVIQGFAIMRRVKIGYKIGPLFANTPAIAAALYRACLNEAIGEPVYLDIPLCNQEAIQLVKDHGARYVFECARMYYGTPPSMDIHKVYGITTFELG